MSTPSAMLKRLFAVLWLLSILLAANAAPRPAASTAVYIVQASNMPAAAASVMRAGGTIEQQLSIINGVSARLDAHAYQRLRAMPAVAVYANAVVRPTDVRASSGKKETDTEGYQLYPSAATGVHPLHTLKVPTPQAECTNRQVTQLGGTEERELQGWGVTVAVVDSGMLPMQQFKDWQYQDPDGTLVAEESGRCIVYRDFLVPPATSVSDPADKPSNSVDAYGHGTHVISTIADNRKTELAAGQSASPVGVAPQVNLMVARVLDEDGGGSYDDVIAAIDWIVANQARYNVRVLNLSLYAPIGGPYWADPMNQAVMRAWQAGLTVVVAAGNAGPEAGTITAPGNVPYVITVGALTSGRYTSSGYDELANYSSRGPTESAFVKPDVLVPATRTIAPMPQHSTLAKAFPDARIKENGDVDYDIGTPSNHKYYYLSGTSMAAAEVSGVAALILQANPQLTNDQVKARLLSTARFALDEQGQPVYSVWEQGAGLIDAQAAIFSTSTESANVGMDIAIDLQTFDDGRDEIHYWGNTVWDETTGEFQLVDPETGDVIQTWNGGDTAWGGGYKSWAGGYKSWAGGYKSWAGGYKSWAGGYKSWAGGYKSWAGSERPWAETTDIPSAASASSLHTLDGSKSEAMHPYTTLLPLLSAAR